MDSVVSGVPRGRDQSQLELELLDVWLRQLTALFQGYIHLNDEGAEGAGRAGGHQHWSGSRRLGRKPSFSEGERSTTVNHPFALEEVTYKNRRSSGSLSLPGVKGSTFDAPPRPTLCCIVSLRAMSNKINSLLRRLAASNTRIRELSAQLGLDPRTYAHSEGIKYPQLGNVDAFEPTGGRYNRPSSGARLGMNTYTGDSNANQELENELATHKALLHKAQDRIKELEGRVSDLHKELAHESELRSSHKIEVKSLKRELLALASNAGAADAEVESKLKEALGEREQVELELEREKQDRRKDNDRMKTKIIQVEEEAAAEMLRYEKQIDTLNTEIQNLQKAGETKSGQDTELREKQKKLQETIDSLQKRIRELEKILSTEKREKEKQSSLSSEWKTEKEILLQRIKDLEGQLTKSDAERKRFREKAKNEEEGRRRLLEQTEKKKMDLEEEAKAVDQMNKKQKQRDTRFQAEIRKLKQEIKSLHAEIEALKNVPPPEPVPKKPAKKAKKDDQGL